LPLLALERTFFLPTTVELRLNIGPLDRVSQPNSQHNIDVQSTSSGSIGNEPARPLMSEEVG